MGAENRKRSGLCCCGDDRDDGECHLTGEHADGDIKMSRKQTRPLEVFKYLTRVFWADYRSKRIEFGELFGHVKGIRKAKIRSKMTDELFFITKGPSKLAYLVERRNE